jgi:TetR/AcrR family transcriptional regulator
VPRPKVIEEAELLDRLLDAFADLGYEGTSLRELCRHLGMSHNLIHKRYQSKAGAWYAAVDHGFEDLLAALDVDVPQHEVPSDPFEALRQVMVKYAEATLQRPALARIIQHEAARPGPRFDYMLKHHIGPTRRRSAARLTALQDAGFLRQGAIEAVYFFLTTWGIGGLASASDELRRTGKRRSSREQLAGLAVDVVIDGLRARPPAQARPTKSGAKSRPGGRSAI